MKTQDVLFFLVLLFFLLLAKSFRCFIILGLFCLVLAFFAFKFWFLFTAERLTWYSGVFLTLGIMKKLLLLFKTPSKK